MPYTAQYYTLRRVRVSRHGYDSTGAYWGVGGKVWEAEIYADAIPGEGHGIGQYQGLDTISFRTWIDASNRSDLKAAHAHVKERFTGIKYRPV